MPRAARRNLLDGAPSTLPLSIPWGTGFQPTPMRGCFSLWTKCLALLDVTCWMARHPLCLCQFHGVRKFGQHRCVAVSPFHVLFVRSLLPVLGIAVGRVDGAPSSRLRRAARGIWSKGR